jgi:hypothetical protein
MFGITKKDKRTSLEREIDSVLEVMSNYKPDSKEYTAMADNLERLYKAKAQISERRVSPDTIAMVAGNLLGIALILGYERTDVIATKALGFVLKGRV